MVPFAELLCPVHGFMEIVAELGDMQVREQPINSYAELGDMQVRREGTRGGGRRPVVWLCMV
jgi:hypothetical protein